MYREELIKAVATETKARAKSVGKMLDALLAAIIKTLKEGGEVKLVGFGTFKTQKRKARTGKNPRTGATIQIAASTSPKFVPGAKLVKAVR